MNLNERDKIANSETPDQTVHSGIVRSGFTQIVISVNPGQTAPSGQLFNSFSAS